MCGLLCNQYMGIFLSSVAKFEFLTTAAWAWRIRANNLYNTSDLFYFFFQAYSNVVLDIFSDVRWCVVY